METLAKKCCCGKAAMLVSGVFFAIIAIMHLLRAVLGWSIICNGTEVPMWTSWFIVVITAAVAAWNFCSCCKGKGGCACTGACCKNGCGCQSDCGKEGCICKGDCCKKCAT